MDSAGVHNSTEAGTVTAARGPATKAVTSDTPHASCFSRSMLVALFWLGAIIALAAMAASGHPGWDCKVYSKTIQDLRHGTDPYAEGIATVKVFQSRYVAGSPEQPPNAYQYPPLTLPLLRLLGKFPDGLLVLAYWVAVAAGVLLQLWAGFQMADKYERQWLPLMLPAILFFPGLITDDVILSGNVAYILYGIILAAAVPGWKRGDWRWYYLAVLAASCCKLPFLSLLAFPVLLDRRQWFRSGITAAAGVLIFFAQMRFWPSLFREYLLAIRMMFDWKREFGFGPAGLLGKVMISRGLSPSPATSILYLAFAVVLGIALLILAGRVRKGSLSQERWVPVALLGTVLLGPRIMKYDLAAISVPMLLIGWRTLRYALERSANKKPMNGTVLNRLLRMPTFVAAGCFLIPNIATVVGPSWFPGELLLLLALLLMGVFSLDHTLNGEPLPDVLRNE